MEYNIIKYFRLVNPTTCYSGLSSISKDGTGYMATENDWIQLSLEDTERVISGRALPPIINHPSSIICVGHAWREDQQVFVMLCKSPSLDGSNRCMSSDGIFSGANTTSNSSSSNHVGEGIKNDHGGGVDVNNNSASNVTNLDSSNDATEESKRQSILVWQNLQGVQEKSLSHRLLAPTFSQVADDQFLLWAGSADDSDLRCFRYDSSGIQRIRIQNYEKSQRVTTSPILCIAACDASDSHTVSRLALGCQDGTVQIVTFTWNDNILSVDDLYKVNVDGPILSLCLTSSRLLVGSMCGYVCQLVLTLNVWGEPSMVVSDLWDERYQADDAVLAVQEWMEDRIVVGTYSGRVECHVRSPTQQNSYLREWSCRFPDAIHALSQREMKLLITTRTSLFCVEARQTYSVEQAKRRLIELLDTNR
jgi:hypothetical protein